VENKLTIHDGLTKEAEESLGENYSTTTRETCTQAKCVEPKPIVGEHNAAEFEQWATESGLIEYSDAFSSASVYIAQTAGPSVEWNTKERLNSGSTENIFYNGGRWANREDLEVGGKTAMAVTGKDPGVGVSEAIFKEPKIGWVSADKFLEKEESGCAGVQCPEERAEIIQSLGGLPEGEDPIEATVKDAAGISATVTKTLRVDEAAPHAITLTGLPAGDEIAEREYKARVEATDGEKVVSSGLASLVIKVDGRRVERGVTGPGFCVSGPCSSYIEWSLNGAEFGAGEHEVAVIATDNAGNVATQTFTLKVHDGTSPVAVGPGEVNPVSGNYTLQASDVSVPTGPSGLLTVGRSYNSRHLGATQSPFGAPWSMSTGGMETLTKQPNGSMILSGIDGGQTTFVSNGKGGFTGPKGDANVTLAEAETEKVKEYVLSNASAGSQTKFRLPAEGGGEVWVPSIQEGQTSTETMSYAFTAVKVAGKEITEPTEILGPVPSGVSCAPKLERGCRALTFRYATSTTASGETWGEYEGRLMEVFFTAWEPTAGAMVTKREAQYEYDASGRLRVEWDPEVSPALKTYYGYDSEGHVTALTSPGQETWAFVYGTEGEDPSTGRLMSVARPSALTALWGGAVPAVKTAPSLSSANPVVGAELTVSHGEWTNSPVAYGYQWEGCSVTGTECAPILGAVDEHYTPLYKDEGKRLEVIVTATNGGGSATYTVAAAGLVPPAYLAQWGSEGTGTSNFKAPSYIAYSSIGGIGHVYVSDTANNRVEVFSKEGKYEKTLGSLGSELGKFKEPQGIAVDSNNNIYVDDTGNKRLVLIHGSEFRKSASTAAAPVGAAISPIYQQGTSNLETVFMPGAKANGVGMLCGSAAYPGEAMESLGACGLAFGSEGSGVGQFKAPTGAAYAVQGTPEAQEGYLYVVDTGNDRVQVFHEKGHESTSAYERQFGTKGTGAGQLEGPTGVALTEPAHETRDAWVADSANNRIEEFGPKGEYMSQTGSLGTGEGQFKHPVGIAAGAEGTLYVVDQGNNRVQELQEKPSKVGPTVVAPAPPSSTSASVWTIDYQVPVSGAGAPNALGPGEVAAWAQKDDPVEGTAIFPPSKRMGWPAKEYTAATIYYTDTAGHTVNEVSPKGAIATSEYNATGDVVRSLSPDNRVTALGEGSKSAEVSQLLDTQSTYNTEGTELLSTLGPQHNVKLATGSETKARAHTLYSYDEGAPTEGGPYQLVTKVTHTAQLESGAETEEQVTTTSYSGQSNLGWELRRPTSTTTDPSGLDLTTTTLYARVSGLPTEVRSPASKGASASPHDTQTIYYSAGSNAHEACGHHPEWEGLPCMTQPAKQPAGTLPELPVATTTYNLWDQPETTTSTSGTSTRTTTTKADTAGRTTSIEATSTNGIALPKTTMEYSTTTGALVKETRTMEGKTRSITNAVNTLGQLESYTDADGNTTSYEYDSSGRVTHMADAKGTQTYKYNETNGMLTELQDSAAGSFTAGYDAEGNLTSEHYPNGMTATTTINRAGEPTSLEYTKSSYCGASCTWYSQSVTPTIDGQWATQTNTLAKDTYTDDNDDRLTQVQETPTGEGCTTRIYGYDEDTNRTSLTTRAPGSEGKCATSGGTTETHSYDEADRLTDPHTSYNKFGDINSLGAADAGGSELTAIYYVDGQTQSLTQNGQTLNYKLDPDGRTREIEAIGTANTTTVNHYDGPGDTPAWTEEPATGNTARYIQAFGGLTAIQTNAGTPVLQLTDLQGNIVATAAKSETETKLLHTERASEYGTPTTSKPEHYSWQGAEQQPTELPSGIVAMGARTYIPQIGRFLQTDPIPGGSANAYAYTYGNPINESDPTGALTWGFSTAELEWEAQSREELIVREAAREAAAREEAARKAEEAQAIAAEGAAEPLGGYAGWLCETAANTGQTVQGCGGEGGVHFVTDPATGCTYVGAPGCSPSQGHGPQHGNPNAGSRGSCRSGGKRDKHGNCQPSRESSNNCSEVYAAAGGFIGGVLGTPLGPAGNAVGAAVGGEIGAQAGKVCE
jgi:RHS repeat-associated protein